MKPTGLHRDWLELVDREGPFLAVAPLKRVWSTGMPNFKKENPKRYTVLNDARRVFEAAWEAQDAHPDDERQLERYREARDVWVRTVLTDVIGWGDRLDWGGTVGSPATSPDRTVTATAQAALRGDDGLGALVRVIDPVDSLRATPNDRWAATPIDRTEAVLRANNVPIGLVTDGRWWGLVYAADGRMAASGVVDALTWVEEPRTRDAFFTLIGLKHLIGGKADERLPQLFDDSVAAAEEITESLGGQVRRAVELLVTAFGEAADEARRHGRPDPLPADTHAVYEAAVTVMMRTVFLLFAEERSLLPSGELFEQAYGIAGELDRLAERATAEGEESLDATTHTWHRLLATSRALFTGASFESLRMPAYGGSLFDPDRFPFLSVTTDAGSLAMTVSDRVMLHVLDSVQVAHIKSEARRISFRDVDVEQIGYIYEGLLGYTCERVDEPFLGLLGKPRLVGSEPEMPLATLERLAAEHHGTKALVKAIDEWTKTDQPGSEGATTSQMAKGIDAETDPSVVSALAQIVGDDDALRDRVEQWLGIVRTDLRGAPLVVPAGRLLVVETPSRRNMGAHYTPKALAEEVVLHALEPICYAPGPHQSADRDEWRLKSSDDLLGLKVADIACGSGAFLVAAARYLAARVVEAWVAENPSNAQRRGLYTRAIRQVVANCIYGADINDMAVEMCKLSLWLVSLDRDLPFSFVDDKVFIGNSLLGLTSTEQLRKLHIDPTQVPLGRKFDIFEVDITGILDKAATLRARLASEIDETDPARTNAAKHRLLAEFRKVTAALRHVADGVVGAGLKYGGVPGKDLDAAYDQLRTAVKQAYPDPGTEPDSSWLDKIIDVGLTPTVPTDYERWQPLHWVLEAPDVIIDHGGFDAIIGNPPFLRGRSIGNAYGDNVRNWLTNSLANAKKGAADLVAFFFLRAFDLCKPSIGLIATNTIAQGDTREVGLDQMVENGFTITHAIQSQPWPTKSANLEFAGVWGTRTDVLASISPISTFLEPQGRASGIPLRLKSSSGIAFKGVNINGLGFLMTPAEAKTIIDADETYAEVVKPYLVGADINATPTSEAPRWIVDFGSRSWEEIQRFPVAVEWARSRVIPQRAHLEKKPKLREQWWRFEAPALKLREAIRDLDEVLAIAVVSKTLMPARIGAHITVSQDAVVFATESFATQAILSSSIHRCWVILNGSGMRTDPRYTPTDVFQTFPLPSDTPNLDSIGRTLEDSRREIMIRRKLGLTDLYNLINDPDLVDNIDPDVAHLRKIHVQIDGAVMDAYGWSDVPLAHGFHTYRQMRRWTVCPTARVEILDRLLEENRRRAAIEAGKAEASTAHKTSAKKPSDMQQTLEGT